MGRELVIGDIHGGLKALFQVLERVKLTPNDRLIFLGDYVDGWSDSANVISYLIKLSQQNSCIFIRGNHEELVCRWLKTGESNEQWLRHGGRASLDSYRKLGQKQIREHILFYEQLFNYYIDQENRLFVHAGFTHTKGPEHEYNDTPYRWDRTLWEQALSLDQDLKPDHPHFPKRLNLFKEIFIGHTPVTRIGESKPYGKSGVWNLDTGAAFKGRLSLMDVDTKEVVQSDPIWQLYPHEVGRN